MSNETEPDKEPLAVRLAQANVTDPELYREAQRLERETALTRLEAEQKRNENQSTAGIIIRELANSLDPGDLVPLVRVVAEALAQTKLRNGSEQDQKRDVTEPVNGDRESPAKRAVTGNRS